MHMEPQSLRTPYPCLPVGQVVTRDLREPVSPDLETIFYIDSGTLHTSL